MKTLPDNLILPPRTIAGAETIEQLLDECAAFGKTGILVHGHSLKEKGGLDRILAASPSSLNVHTFEFPGGEPTLAQLDELLARARAVTPAWIAAVGGGSVMDVAKACAGLLEAPLPPLAYHDGEAIPTSQVPFIASPTTAGTGSESTIVSVLTNDAQGMKKSIRHPSFMARLVILDHELLYDCPRHVIASSGMDAFTQAAESYVSRGATWFSDQAALKGLRLIASSLVAVASGAKGNAARDLMQGSYLAGLALSNARLGLVHGLAHPLGYRYHEAHGLVCAVCLPAVLAFNREAIGDKYDRMSNAVGGDLLQRTDELMSVLDIMSPFKGQPVKDREGIIQETIASGSTKANPRDVTAGDVEDILETLF